MLALLAWPGACWAAAGDAAKRRTAITTTRRFIRTSLSSVYIEQTAVRWWIVLQARIDGKLPVSDDRNRKPGGYGNVILQGTGLPIHSPDTAGGNVILDLGAQRTHFE